MVGPIPCRLRAGAALPGSPRKKRRVGLLLSRPYEPGYIPSVNLGEFGVQILSVLDAQFRIRSAFNTLQNIPRRVQIEQDRSSAVIRIVYDATRRINATELALAYASSFNVSASVSAFLMAGLVTG